MNNHTNFTVQDFEPANVVTGIGAAPRFGRSSEFDALFGSRSEQQSYLVGVTIAGIVVASVFLLWASLLLVFMCCGPDNAGFLSGRPFRQEEVPPAAGASKRNPSFDDDDEAADDSLGKRESQRLRHATAPSCSNRPTRIRSAFLVCGAIFVTFSILLVTEGLNNLQTTVDVLQGSTAEVNRLSSEAVDVLENGFLRAGAIATAVRDEIERQLDGGAFCPNDPSLENSPEGLQFRTEAVDAVGQLDTLGDFMTSNIEELLVPLKRTVNETAYFESKIAPVNLTDWRAMLALIPYTVVPALLMAGVLVALFDVSLPGYNCLLNWAMLPLFVVLVALAWAVASGMIVLGGMNGDFCLPGGYYEGNPPDETIRNIMEALGYANTTAYEIVDFYVSQCREKDPFGFVESAVPQLQEAQDKIVNLAKLIVNPSFLSALSLYCNRDYSDLQELVNNMDSLIALLMDSVIRTLDLIDCDRIVPLYTETVYQGMCTYAPSAVFWVFSCCLLMGVTGMLMITFRSSYKLTRYGPSDENDYLDDDAGSPRTQDDDNADEPNESMVSDDLYLSDRDQRSSLRGADSYDDDVDRDGLPPPERAPPPQRHHREDDDEEGRQPPRRPSRPESPF